MASEAAQAVIRVSVAQNAIRADIVIPHGISPEAMTIELARAAAHEAGIVVDAAVIKKMEESLEEARNAEMGEVRAVIAEAELPKHGKDGWIEWNCDGDTEQATADAPDDDDVQVDHRAKSAFTMVKEGQTIGRIVPPVEGVDGIDVRGNAIPAREGREAQIKLDETIEHENDGSLVALATGALTRANGKASIEQLLEIHEYVDYNTGNIDFDGPVIIHRGIKDLFEVKATGDVTVNGLVERATIRAGGNTILAGGMAGRGEGEIFVGGDLIAKYLDSMHGEVLGAFELAKEAISCTLRLHGPVHAPTASIIGGSMTLAQTCEVASLGSEAGVQTIIKLGSAPGLDVKLERATHLAAELASKLEAERKENGKLSEPGRRLSTDEMERQMELALSIQSTEKLLDRAGESLETIRQSIRKHRLVELTVQTMLHQGVVLRFEDRDFVVRDSQRGPMTIYLDANDRPVFRRGEGPSNALTAICDPKALHDDDE